MNPKLALFPINTRFDAAGELHIGGCNASRLVREYGTPLYVFDELTLRHRCREFKVEFTRRYPETVVAYASKAFLIRAMAKLLAEESMHLDVVSGGELAIARAAGFPADRIYFHGNNKTPAEIEYGLKTGIGRFVVDSFHELDLLTDMARGLKVRQDVLIRINPGVDAHTHKLTTTGITDSKFGFQLATGAAEEALRTALMSPSLRVAGLHFHLGSPIYELAVYETGIEVVMDFAAKMLKKHDFTLHEFSVGGGFAAQYTVDKPAPSVAEYAEAITGRVTHWVNDHGLPPPILVIEPGRSIVARAGVALYTVGAIKDIPGVRKYVCVDGGMGDNIRPAIYGSQYEAVLANRGLAPESAVVSIAGKFCESGDILIKDGTLAEAAAGDILAVPVCGAYCVPMSSNYNAYTRPAIVMVNDGRARLARKRESYADLFRLDEP
jgi:diaminopimelate decarboxylase